jgi:hypothetical protein
MADTKTEKKDEVISKHKLPEGYITPVEATHRLKKEVNPATGEPYAKASLSSQQVYTLLRTAETNKMPVHHFDAEGHKHKTRQTDGAGHVTTRPGFKWDELSEWWANRPARGSSSESGEEEKKAEDSTPSGEVEEDVDDEAYLEEADDDDELVEAE